MTSHFLNFACLQLNQEAVADHAKKMWTMPSEIIEAVNACVSPHFPEHVDKTGDNKTEKNAQFVQVYRG